MKLRAAENRDFSFNSFLKTSCLQTNEWEGDASDFQPLRSTGEFCGRPGAVVCFRPGGEVRRQVMPGLFSVCQKARYQWKSINLYKHDVLKMPYIARCDGLFVTQRCCHII
ncbi:hypothetical protein CDAR_307211 [Caerostris darwini]|uniref:Uncharacterized protein n=1 Tax=Caerostris darwini TaxID=1538125 RepID=A0AAV4T9Q8_9ARAC|nr:hypothetical protein CDAR_307211 [Caerostris darwini]